MDVSEQQLRQWRDFMDQVYIGTWEIEECQSKRNEQKMIVVLEYLAANALRWRADLEQYTGLPPVCSELPLKCLHNTEANERFLFALKQAMYAAFDVDREKFDDDAPAGRLLAILVADVEREVYGPLLDDEGPSLFAE